MVGLCLGLGCRESSSTASTQQATSIETLEPREASNERARSEPIAPLAEAVVPGSPAPSPELVALGAELFESNILSEDGKVSCRSCHDPAHGFADAVPRSAPEGRRALAVNTPTLLNVGLLGVFNWNGRHTSLGDHLDGLIQNPLVHATTWASLARRLRASADWSARFARVFPGGIDESSARTALLAYERSLIGPGAPFDRWLAGDGSATSSAAQRGYALFKS